MLQKPVRRNSTRSTLIKILQLLTQAAIVFLVVTALIGRFVVHQTSMEPNFHEGQRVVVSKFGSLWSELFVTTAHAAGRQASAPVTFHRGQIAVFYDNHTQAGDPLIKRVIGVPGDTIEIRRGAIVANGTPLAEPYLRGIDTECITSCGPFTLGGDEYFMLGDNRPVSRDSRSFGPVHADQLVGQVVARYWPLDQFTWFL